MQRWYFHRCRVGNTKEDAVDEIRIYETKVGKYAQEDVVLEMPDSQERGLDAEDNEDESKAAHLASAQLISTT